MPIQIIRDTYGFITTGNFCQVGSTRPKSSFTCDGATYDFVYTIAMNPTYNDQFMEAMQSIIVTIDGVEGGLETINPDNNLDQYEITDQSYTIPPNFISTTDSVLLNVRNTLTKTRRVRIYIPVEYRNVLVIVVPEQQNQAIVITNGSIEVCLNGAIL